MDTTDLETYRNSERQPYYARKAITKMGKFENKIVIVTGKIYLSFTAASGSVCTSVAYWRHIWYIVKFIGFEVPAKLNAALSLAIYTRSKKVITFDQSYTSKPYISPNPYRRINGLRIDRGAIGTYEDHWE